MNLPVIVISGMRMESRDLEKALEEGAVDYMRKPLDKCEFRARINASLRTRQQHEAIEGLLQTEKELLEDSLRTKERELTSKSMYDYQRDELLKKLLEQVGRLNRITQYVHATNIKAIENELRSQINMERMWSEFNLHFEQVHPGFFEHLKFKYKTLTQNDCKLCAYLKMGLGNSEIANFMHIARGSVERALNRLKKKMGLRDCDCLRDFVVQFS